MSNHFCLSCGHEFPSAGAKFKPDRVGLFIFTGIGLLGVAFAVVCGVLAAMSDPQERLDFLWYAGLSLVGGLVSIGVGRALGKGMYAYCPACGKAMALPSESNSAKYEKRKRGLT